MTQRCELCGRLRIAALTFLYRWRRNTEENDLNSFYMAQKCYYILYWSIAYFYGISVVYVYLYGLRLLSIAYLYGLDCTFSEALLSWWMCIRGGYILLCCHWLTFTPPHLRYPHRPSEASTHSTGCCRTMR